MRRKSQVSGAVLAVAIGTLILVAAKKSLPAYEHYGLPAFAYLIAVGMLVRAATGFDNITKDVRAGKVASVEGAITKRRVNPSNLSSGGGTSAEPSTLYYLDVQGQRLETGRNAFEAAPEAGIVRVYYLPRSKRVVNLEVLPDRPIPEGKSPIDSLKDYGRGMLSGGEVARADARAEMAAFGHQMEAETHRPDTPPAPGQGDPRPLAQAIVGTWVSQLATVTFVPDGTLTISGMMGLPISQTGRWGIDAEGHLTADGLQLMGPGGVAVPTGKHEDKHHRHEEPASTDPPPGAEAWVKGDQLTIHFEEYTLVFQRQGAASPS
ncbi:MAG: hypothetical protein ACRDJU_08720 [Actinomycetota bacterium]